jgi:hypothetical protein
VTVQEIYDGSDGEATKALYARLSAIGVVGVVALNLFRAQKASARAKVYRGGVRGQGSYRGMAYDRKGWALSNLCAVLVQHAPALNVTFGWGRDDSTLEFSWVLYVDLPTGQVSFHARTRGDGPDYTAPWDGVRGVSADRIVRWCEALLGDAAPAPIAAAQESAIEAAPRWLWCRHCACFWANRRLCPVHPRTALIEKQMPSQVAELRPGVRAEWED